MQRVSGWDFLFERAKIFVVVLGVVIAGMVFLEVNGESARFSVSGPGPQLDVAVRGLPGGVDIGMTVHRFAFADGLYAAERDGAAGAAQVYLDGRLVAEVYAPRVVLPDVEKGYHRVRVALVDVRHRPLGVEREVRVDVP
ncbi:MAG: hypothetical protein IRY98_07085 [Alicyclobacillaceae bacterium]|nr:hypothetical protein [Alicyclobacillaceae bacterium]